VPAGRQNRVEYFELFFDLVYVFTFIQITQVITSDGSITGIVHGTVVLMLVWWVWAAFTTLANMGLPVKARRDWRPLLFAVAMGLVLLMALSTPEAFWGDSKLFAFSYLGLALLAMGGQFWVMRDDPSATRALRRLWLVAMVLPVLVVITSYLEDETISVILIGVGLVTAVIAPFAAGSGNLPISTHHLAERYSLVMLITLGESIISLGQGASKVALSPLVVACVLLTLALVVILWRHYVVAVIGPGARALRTLQEPQLTAMVRYGYTFAHFAMVWGIVIIAVAIKSALVDLTTPLDDLLEAGLAAGTLVFLVATAAFAWLAGQRPRVISIVSLAALGILVVAGPQLPTAALIVAVTLAAAVGIDPRGLGMRRQHEEQVSSPQ
jgi:low temperature requirement protein LtrA